MTPAKAPGRPWPRSLGSFACECPPTLPASRACETRAHGWIRCNARLAAVRAWQWDEEERLGLPHPEGAWNPHAAEATT